MTFTLSSQNIFDYLAKNNIVQFENKEQIKIELKVAKNFNLLIKLQEERQLLVKQERHNLEGQTAGEFINEWRMQEFLKFFPELNFIQPWLPEAIHFDVDNSLIIFNYLADYLDLADFYAKEHLFEPVIADKIGQILANIHRVTFNREDYRYFLSQHQQGTAQEPFLKLTRHLNRVEPEIFGLIPAEGMKFFALYQRYDSLGKAIADLIARFNPCCLVHNDLKLNNILLHLNWKTETSSQSPVKLIDWERSVWGDPAFDLGTLIASYLQLWLSSLVVSKTINIEESLSLAMIPLEQLQPSIAALLKAYLKQFPQILSEQSDFLSKVMQFTGLALIYQIQATIQYQKTFGNTGICTLQVAKSLLCRPEFSIPTVCGCSESELNSLVMVNR